MKITPTEFNVAQEWFLRLRELAIDEREHRLAALRKEHGSIAEVVEKLLRNDLPNDSFLETPLHVPSSIDDASESPSTDQDDRNASHRMKHLADAELPKWIGPYRVLRQVGEGGHGIVFLAEQAVPVRRQVAIKRIKPGMQSKMILARFEAERQALAIMKHPAIANVLDAGTDQTGCPYFVMEFVEGMPIDEFCTSRELDLDATLLLFQQVCRAVHYAHRKGVIHRDIKPGNILVTQESGQPVPKVIDFGIAKAMHLTLTENTVLTEYGQIIGTLEYMSPEQAMLSHGAIDVRSDVYSLGALLYQLLTGTPPHDKHDLLRDGIHDIERTLRHTPLPTPSARLTRDRQTERSREKQLRYQARWASPLKGDLDWITMKALAIEPERRYDSAAALADDLENWRRGATVVARPPSWTYAARKFIRRHRIAVGGLGVLLVGLSISLAGIVWGYWQTTQRLEEVADAKQVADEKARQLETSLESTRFLRSLADLHARNLSSMLNRQRLEQAWSEANGGDLVSAQRSLDQVLSSQRGYAWKWVSTFIADESPSSSRPSLLGPIRHSAVSPNSGKLALLHSRGMLEVWDLAEEGGDALLLLDQPLADCLAISPDGEQVLVGRIDEVSIIEVATRRKSYSVKHGHGGTRDAVFDSKRKQWHVTTGSNVLVSIDSMKAVDIHRLPERIHHVLYLDSEDAVLVCGLSGRCYLVDLTDRSVKTIGGAASEVIDLQSVGNEVLGRTLSGELLVWERVPERQEGNESETLVWRVLESKIDRLDGIKAAWDPRTWIVADNQGMVSLARANGTTVPLQRFSSSIQSLHRVRSPNVLVVVLIDGRVSLIWEALIESVSEQARTNVDITTGQPEVSRTTVFTAHGSGMVRRWDLAQGEELAAAKIHDGEILSLSWNDLTGRLATVGTDWTIGMSSGDTLSTNWQRPIALGVRDVKISHDGKFVAGPPELANDNDLREGTIDLWRADTGEAVQRFAGHTNWVMQIEWSRDGQRLYTLSVDGYLRVWNVAQVECERSFDFRLGPRATSFTYVDGVGRLAVGHEDGSVTLWKENNGARVSSKIVTGTEVAQVLSPFESDVLLVSSKHRPSLQVIDRDSLELLASFDMGIGEIQGIRLDNESTRLQVVGESGVCRTWTLP